MSKKSIKRKKAAFGRASLWITGAAVLAMTVVAFLLPLRPSVSATEKRELAKFPAFTWASLWDGSYFAGISTWFSDTVPFRDTLIGVNAKVQHILGTGGAQAGFNEGMAGDEIPDVPDTKQTSADKNDAASQPEATAENGTAAQPETEKTTAGAAAAETAAAGNEEAGEPAPAFEKLSNILVSGNAGYEYYNFVQSTADNYAAAVNRAAAALDGKAQVYAMVIPTSTGITLDPRVRAQLSSSDQEKATAYIESQFDDSVKPVHIFDTLTAHRDEYIYFRTDHHWTELGAYYAYVEFCKTKGVKPVELKYCERRDFDNFLGSFYSDSGQNPALGNTPDVVETYLPPADAEITITDANGYTYTGDVIYNAEDSIPAYKYSAYIWGDNPFSVINNKGKKDGESCLLIKESFGNAFAPLLVGHYKYVYVMDYRYCDKTVAQLVEEYGIDDVIFANNLSMTRADVLVDKLASKID